MGAMGLYAPETMRGVDAGECDVPLAVHLSGEAVDAFKKRIDPFFVSADLAIDRCVAMPPEEKQVWSAFYLTWKMHLAKETHWFFAGEDWRLTCSYAHTLDAWRKKLGELSCAIPGPAVIEAPVQGAELLSAVKWGAAAVLVAAVVYGVTRIV